jgi:DNA repair protein REV1
MAAAGSARAKTVTLKLKRRQQGAPEPAKFLGHGACDNLSRRCVCEAAWRGVARAACVRVPAACV